MKPVYCTLCLRKCLRKEKSVVKNRCSSQLAVDKDDYVLKNRLEVIFLTRKILEMPQDTCCTFLADYGDPCSWIDFCDSCLDLVRKGKLLFDQMTTLQRKFKTLQNQIKNEITGMEPLSKNELDEVKMGVNETIKSFIRQGGSDAKNSSLGKVVIKEENSDWDPEDYYPEEDDSFRLDKTEDCSDTYHDLGIKEERLLTGFRHPGKEQEFNSDVSSNENFESNSKETNAKSGNVNVSRSLNELAYREPNQTLKTERVKRIENRGKYGLRKKIIRKIPKSKTRNEDHTVERQNKCNFCGKVFHLRSSLAKHEKRHAADKPFKCELCEKSYISLSDLARHERSHSGKRPYICDTCGKDFPDLSGLNKHNRIHTGERPHKCNYCEKSFIGAYALKVHEKIHSDKCDICGKDFSEPGSLIAHKKIHSGERPHKCKYCDKSYNKGSNLKIHERIHTGERPYKCDTCGKDFSDSTDLTKHKKIHSGERPHKCSYCEKSFVKAGDLKVHERIHTGERPFKCETCGEAFSRSGYLILHRRRKHTGERPYQCKTCEKCFTATSDLKIHERIHTGEKPYQCDICGKSFSASTDLTKHKRIHIEKSNTS